MDNFADRVLYAIKEKKSVLCVGLDPTLDKIPDKIKGETRKLLKGKEAVADAIRNFNIQLISALYDVVPVVKPNAAFYEGYGPYGISALQDTIDYAHSQGLIVIFDAKRNDIGSTAERYARATIGDVELLDGIRVPGLGVDAVTVNAYLGSDCVNPFLKYTKNDKGIFVLDVTSNPSQKEIQGLVLDSGLRVSEAMALCINGWGKDSVGESGYSSVGAVVGATYPEDAEKLREIMPHTFFLIPGYGAQGAPATDAVISFDENGQGGIVNSSRGVFAAWQNERYKNDFPPEKFAEAARQSAKDSTIELNLALKNLGKAYW